MPAGLPVERLWMTRIPRTMDLNAPSSLIGVPGPYKVICVLGRPKRLEELGEAQQGNSLIAVPQAGPEPNAAIPIVGMDVDLPTGTVHLDGFVNPQGMLAKIVVPQIQATSFFDAELRAHRATAMILSQLAVRFNIPLEIVRTECHDLRTESARLDLRPPYVIASFPGELCVCVRSDFMFYASLYHEGLRTNSEVYQFLCFYKIIEALRKRRERIAQDLRKRGDAVPSKPREVIPATMEDAIPWLNQLFNMDSAWGQEHFRIIIPREVRGRRFGQVIDRYLRPVRDRIAHAVLDSGELTTLSDDMLHVNQIYHWIGITMSIARAMMRTDFPEAF